MSGVVRALLTGAAAVIWLATAPAARAVEEAAGRPPSPQAAEALQLLTSEDDYQRKLGFLRLEALRELSTLPTLRAYLTDRDPEMRAYSLRAVAAVEGVAAAPTLVATLQADKEPRVRRAAVLGLEPFAMVDQAWLPPLLKALTDRSTEVRMTAVDVVSRIPNTRAREAILTRHRREQRPDVRRVLELAVKRLGG